MVQLAYLYDALLQRDQDFDRMSQAQWRAVKALDDLMKT